MVNNNKDTQVIWNGSANKAFKDVIAVYPCSCCNATGKSIWDTMNESTLGFDYCINEITKVLMPLIEEKYSVLTGRENTAICGFSMGGREAINIGFTRPDLFCGIAGFCPAPGIFETPYAITKDELCLPNQYLSNTVVQITKGAKDTTVNDNPLIYHNLFTEKGIPHLYYETMGRDEHGEGNGTHWKHVWQHGLYNFLKLTFPVDK